MCLAVPGRVLEIREKDGTAMADVDFGGVRREVCLEYIPDVQIGEYVVVARRRGKEWFLGALNNERAREVRVPLDFLGGGRYRLTLYADGARPSDITTTDTTPAGADLTLKLAPGGGAAARLAEAGP